jgi:hypothetical protein
MRLPYRLPQHLSRRLLLCAAVLFGFSLASGGVSAWSEGAEYTFRRSLVNGPGVQSLADLSGRPVLIDFWGTR